MKYYIKKTTIFEEIYTVYAASDSDMEKLLEIEDISKFGTKVSIDEDIKLDWWSSGEKVKCQ